jgi:hypothetical protein
MKAIIEHLIVAVIAVGMSLTGFWLIGWYNGTGNMGILPYEPWWTIQRFSVSILTWLFLYRVCRNLHWLVMPAMGLFSPIIGAVLFFIPYFWAPFIIILAHAPVVFPTGIACGFFISVATLPFRPKAVRYRNAE